MRSFSTSHDAVDPVGYRVDAPDGSLGILTDTGFVTDAARESLAGVDTLLLEANHDVETLQYGPHPYFLKRRILGDEGHLSNDAAAEFARLAVQSGTRDILLAHLSKENNTPELAEYAVASRAAVRGTFRAAGVAPRRHHERGTSYAEGHRPLRRQTEGRPFYAAAVAEYQKRLQRHCKLEIVELPEQKRLPSRLPPPRSSRRSPGGRAHRGKSSPRAARSSPCASRARS